MATKKKAKKRASVKYKGRVYKKARRLASKVKRTASTGARAIKEAIK